MTLHDNFEWDQDKAQKNLKKHGVSFDDAALVLAARTEKGSTSRSMIAGTAPTRIAT
jgi:uncharacterized DUF497 family protein